MSETTTTSLSEQVLSLLTAIDERLARIEIALDLDDRQYTDEEKALIAADMRRSLAEPERYSYDDVVHELNLE